MRSVLAWVYETLSHKKCSKRGYWESWAYNKKLWKILNFKRIDAFTALSSDQHFYVRLPFSFLFYHCNKTPWSHCFWGRESMIIMAGSMTAGIYAWPWGCIWELTSGCTNMRQREQIGNGISILIPIFPHGDTPSPVRPHPLTLPKQFHQLEIKYTNICGPFSFKPQQLKIHDLCFNLYSNQHKGGPPIQMTGS